MNANKEVRTTGSGEHVGSKDRTLWCSVDRYQHGQGPGEKHLWRFTIATDIHGAGGKVEGDASPELLRKLARWCERTATLVENDGVIKGEST